MWSLLLGTEFVFLFGVYSHLKLQFFSMEWYSNRNRSQKCVYNPFLILFFIAHFLIFLIFWKESQLQFLSHKGLFTRCVSHASVPVNIPVVAIEPISCVTKDLTLSQHMNGSLIQPILGVINHKVVLRTRKY